MRLLFVLLLSLVPLATSGLSLCAQKAEEGEKSEQSSRAATELAELLQLTADQHVALGTSFQSAGDLGRAIRQYRSAIWLRPELASARQALGYKREGDAWVPGKMLREPEPVDESTLTEEQKSAREREAAARDRTCAPLLRREQALATGVAENALRIARKAQRAGDDATQTAALSIAGAYRPYDEQVAKARGFVARQGEWEHPRLGTPAAAAARRLGESSTGRPLSELDPQCISLEWKSVHRRTDDTTPFAVRTTVRSSRSSRLMQVADATNQISRELLGADQKSGFKEGRFVITEVESRDQFGDWLKQYDTSPPHQKIANQRATCIWTNDPFGIMVHRLSDEGSDDATSNSIAIAVLWNVRGRHSSPWVTDGFAYAVTTRLLGTTMTKRYEVEARSRTHDWHYELNRTPKGNPYGPAEFRRLALEMVRLGGDLTFTELSQTTTNKMTERHVAKSLSLMEYLATDKPAEMRTWLTDSVPGSPTRDLERLLAVLGTDEAGLQEAWQKWIAAHY